MLRLQGLPFDIFPHVFASLDSDTRSLYSCTLVSRMFRDAATPSLYRKIYLDSVRDHDGIRNYTALNTLDRHVRLRGYVESVVHHPSSSEAEAPHSPGNTLWAESVSRLPNLVSYTISVGAGPPLPIAFISLSVGALASAVHLREVKWLFDVYRDHITLLNSLSHIRSLKIGRLMWSALPVLALSLQRLESLDLLDAESIDWTGMLQIQPSLSGLKRLVLGPRHTLPRHLLFSMLQEIPHLSYLDLYYDNFINDLAVLHNIVPPGSTEHGLPALRQFIIRHQGVAARNSFDDLFTWLGHLLAGSAHLTSFSLISDDKKECLSPVRLMQLLKTKQDLRVLNVPYVHLRGRDLQFIFSATSRVERLSFFLAAAENLDFGLDGHMNLASLHLTSRVDHRTVAKHFRELMKPLGRNAEAKLQVSKQGPGLWTGFWTSRPAYFTGRDSRHKPAHRWEWV